MNQDRPNDDHPARSIATEMVVRVMLDRTDPALRDTRLREATSRAAAM